MFVLWGFTFLNSTIHYYFSAIRAVAVHGPGIMLTD